MRNIKNYTILDRIGTLTAVFTAATTDICTSAAHGLKNGDKVVLTTVTTLPSPLATGTVYWVMEATTNTFKLSATSVPGYTTAVAGEIYTAIDITDTGTGAHTFTMHDIGKDIDVSDYRHCILSIHGDDSANIDIGVVGSIGKSPSSDGVPDFSAAAAYNNSWGFLETINLITGSAVDGAADAISMTGTNKHEQHEININGMKWINVIMSGWSAGSVTVVIRCFND